MLYPAGHNVVLYSPETKSQRLMPGTLESEGISALCVSGNRRLLAVAERSDKAMVTVYDLQTLKRRKQLTTTEAGSKEYVSMSFSADGKMLLAQGGAPEWNLVLWVWEKGKVISTVKSTNQQNAPIYSVSGVMGTASRVACFAKQRMTVVFVLIAPPAECTNLQREGGGGRPSACHYLLLQSCKYPCCPV